MTQKNTTLDDLASVIGFSATVKLAAWFGGQNLYVPDSVAEGQVLVRLVGMSAAVRLSKEWARAWLAVPPVSSYEDEVRRRLIARMIEQGFGPREVARHVAMSERRVQQICRELEQTGLIPVIAPKNAAGKGGSEFAGKTLQEKGASNSPSDLGAANPLPNRRKAV